MIPKEKVKTILFITLSNLGDIVLTTPVFQKLHAVFPHARIDVITGLAGKVIFEAHPAVRDVYVHEKHLSVGARMKLVLDLRHRRYDMVVDLKNSVIPYIAGAKFHSRLFSKKAVIQHKKDEHLSRLAGLVPEVFSDIRFFIPVNDGEKKIAKNILKERFCPGVIINPGSKSHLKRWGIGKYAELADKLISELGCRVFLSGNEDDKDVVAQMISRMTESVTDLCCKTSIGVLSELMCQADLVITGDSAPLHIASAVNAAIVAIFGPSDDRKYGPLSDKSRVITPDSSCRPCGKALCATGPDEGCLHQVSVGEVFRAARELLSVE